jgi:integrase
MIMAVHRVLPGAALILLPQMLPQAENHMKFTDRAVKNLKPKKGRYEVWEGNGFGLRITPKGKKTWQYVYHFNNRSRRLTFGRYPDISVAVAHQLLGKALADREKGIDPGKVRVDENIAERKAGTIADLVDEFIERHAKRYRLSWKEDERMLKYDLVPALGDYKVKDVTRRDITRLLDNVVDRPAPIVANRLKSLIVTMFNFAVDKAIVDSSPVIGLKPPAPEKPKERALTEQEVYKFWHRLDETGLDILTKLALKLQLTVGQRSGEIVTVEWHEIDRSERLWTIPAPKTKTKKAPHVVPLSDFALSLLDQIEALSHGSNWVFPSERSNKHRARTSLSRALHRNMGCLGTEPFTPHDIRRTVRTELGRLGVPPHIAEKVINHSDKKIQKTYDRYSYIKEKREALDLWAEKLQRIVNGESNVIKIANG